MSSNIQAQAFKILRSWAGYQTIMDLLSELNRLEVYVVGGVLRDILLGINQPRDIDFLIAGDDVDSALAILAEQGTLSSGPFGSPRWYPSASEQTYCDIVPLRSFYNGLWRCENITDALNQFDFTGNALGLELRTGTLFDPQNGQRDLRRRIMRAVRFDYPSEPISRGQLLTRPAVLWFRLLHYAAAKGLVIEPITMKWLRENRHFYVYMEHFCVTFFPLHPLALKPLG